MIVLKRDGSTQEFDFSKIENAVKSAYKSVNKEMTDDLLNILKDNFKDIDPSDLSVENIQERVEKTLFLHAPYDVARSYMIYRAKHKELRFAEDRIEYMEHYERSNSNAATSSETDPNANVTIKNVVNQECEVYKTQNRETQRRRMTKRLKLMFPEVYDLYEKDINHHAIYVNDEASTPCKKYYCQAVTLYPLLIDGTTKLDGCKVDPPNNITAFCGQLVNAVFTLSGQCKGAVGLGELFNFLDYFFAKKWGPKYNEIDNEFSDSEFVNDRKTISQEINQYFQNIVYSINQSQGNRGGQSPFTNVNYFDSNYWHALFDDFYFPDGTKPQWERVSYLQKKFMKWFNKERTKTLLTFPVESLCLLTDGKDVIDKEYKNFAAEMWSEGHSFFVYLSNNPDSVATCCRVRNEIKDNTFSSLNGLTGVQTGSVNVITLNLSRIIQDYCRKEKYNQNCLSFDDKEVFYKGFEKELFDILTRVKKYHIAFKTMLYESVKNNMFTSVTGGFINFERLYSTIGLNGINEAAEYVGLKCNYNKDYVDFLVRITSFIRNFCSQNSTPKFQLNFEVVPAEGLSSKNYKWDKEDGYWVPESRNLYNSYFYLQDDKDISIFDKFKLHGGEIAKACSGGQAAHINLEDHLSKEQYLKLLDFAIEVGTSYFTFNIPNSQCDDCGFITKHPMIKCPKCGSENITQWTRVIGFMRPIKCFDRERYKEALTRYYMKW